eukprot:Pgem_evm1s246
MVNFDIPDVKERRREGDLFFATRIWANLVRYIHSKELVKGVNIIEEKGSGLRRLKPKEKIVDESLTGCELVEWVLEWTISQGMKSADESKAIELCKQLVEAKTLLPMYHEGFIPDKDHVYIVNADDPNFNYSVERRGTQKRQNPHKLGKVSTQIDASFETGININESGTESENSDNEVDINLRSRNRSQTDLNDSSGRVSVISTNSNKSTDSNSESDFAEN